MSKVFAPIAGFVLVLGCLCAQPRWAAAYAPGEGPVIEKINEHGFTFTEQILPGGNSTLGSAFLLSNCPRKGCVTLSGTYNMSGPPGPPYVTPLLVEGSECRPTLAPVAINDMWSNDIILTVPPDPACAGVLQQASGRYFAICHWDAPDGDLGWTGSHKNYRCWSAETGKPFPVGPR